jgi:diguanylate cyclase (GGDEF)-like protein/PAS domain S-box-containing protein
MTSTVLNPSLKQQRPWAVIRLQRFVLCAAIWFVGLLVLPHDLAGIWYVLFLTGTVVICIRRRGELTRELQRPVGLILGAGALYLLGGVVRGLVIGADGRAPLPSIADPLWVGSTICFICSIFVIVRRRNPRVGLDPKLDAAVATVAVALLQWTLVLIPQMQSDQLSPAGKATNIIFGTLALAEVAVAVLALVAGSVPTTSNRLLAMGLVGAFTLDAMVTLNSIGRWPEQSIFLVSGLVFILGAAGLLHPSIHQLLDRPDDVIGARLLSRRRIRVLAMALITPPGLMLWAAVNSSAVRLTFLLPVVASLALSPLVLTRLGRLVRQNEELASMEASLRSVGERLVSAESEKEVAGVIAAGVEQVLRRNFVDGSLVLQRDGANSLSVSPHAEALQHLTALIGTSGHRTTGELVALPAPGPGLHRTGGLIVVQRSVRGLLVTTTKAEITDEERNALVTLCREAAIALRAVEQTELNVRRRSEDRFATLVDNSSDIVAILDREGRVTYSSPVVERLLGNHPAQIVGRELLDLVHPDDRDAARRMLDDVRFGLRDMSELRLIDADGAERWFETVGVDLSSDPNIDGIVINAREISDRKRAEDELLLSEARFKALVQNSTDLVVVLGDDLGVRYSSPSVGEVIGRSPQWITGKRVEAVFRECDLDWADALGAGPDETGAARLHEFTFRTADGQWRTIETTITDLRSEPAVGGWVLNARDVTDRKHMEQRLRYQATHDDLTGLGNRLNVLEDLNGILERNSGSTTVAAVLIGLDNFKEINDSLGHSVGDQLLVAVAARITSLLGFGDIAGRIGGDQYVVVLERGHGEQQVSDLAEQILSAIAVPHQIDGRELTVTASAGIVFDHDRSQTAEILLRNADIAMYRAKAHGKRQVAVFEPHMHADNFNRLQLRGDLARALAQEQFVVHYQPVVEIDSRAIVGVEALVRWEHPERGLLGPNVFIPLAEETGMIDALGQWVLERACKDLVSWRSAIGEPATRLTMSVNLSVQQLEDEGIVRKVDDVLARTGMPAELLVLEVTESTLISDTDRIRNTMRELRGLGARLAVDDFGTGYSSLGYIQQFEFDVLKIDKSFVDSLETHTNQRIVTAVLELARQLGVHTIAEGIESELQSGLLADLGCRYAQGYLYSRPVPAADLEELLAAATESDQGRTRT